MLEAWSEVLRLWVQSLYGLINFEVQHTDERLKSLRNVKFSLSDPVPQGVKYLLRCSEDVGLILSLINDF